MMQPTPRELMQASVTCLVLAGVALPWDPLLSGELLIAAGVLGGVAAMPDKPRLVELRVNDMSVSSEQMTARLVMAGSLGGHIITGPDVMRRLHSGDYPVSSGPR